MRMVHIPVVMATDNHYIPLIVSLTSMIRSAKKDTFYHIYILIDDSFTEESELNIKKCLGAFEGRYLLSFKNVGHVFDNALVMIPHITRPTYYRLMIPELLAEDKCIYLDSDTVILSDLQELYAVSLNDCYIAGVWHPGVILYKWEEGICNNAKIPSADQYINAGVLVMNLEEMRKDGIAEKFMEIIPQNMPSQDQDIINHVCYGKIAFLPFKYNVMTKLADVPLEDYRGCYGETELKDAWNRPCIIHYADAKKPWNSLNCVFMDFWWGFFRKSSAYELMIPDFFEDMITDMIYCASGGLAFTKKVPYIFNLKYDRDYVVYGAGKRAMDVILYMKRLNIRPRFIVVSDYSGNPLKIEGIEVKEITDAGEALYNKSIIVAVRESLQKEIIKNLLHFDCFEILPISDEFLLSKNEI